MKLSRLLVATEALFCYLTARVALKILPFRILARWMGTSQAHPETDTVDGALLEELRGVVGAVATQLGPRENCFPQALTAKAMLRRRGFRSVLWLGADVGMGFRAHAWLECGGAIVTGASLKKSHRALVSFTEPRSRCYRN